MQLGFDLIYKYPLIKSSISLSEMESLSPLLKMEKTNTVVTVILTKDITLAYSDFPLFFDVIAMRIL
jgi:hypothetical protein